MFVEAWVGQDEVLPDSEHLAQACLEFASVCTPSLHETRRIYCIQRIQFRGLEPERLVGKGRKVRINETHTIVPNVIRPTSA